MSNHTTLKVLEKCSVDIFLSLWSYQSICIYYIFFYFFFIYLFIFFFYSVSSTISTSCNISQLINSGSVVVFNLIIYYLFSSSIIVSNYVGH